MIVSVVLDTEYMGMAERKKWFLKMLSEAQKTDMLIVTHEYMKTHMQDIIDECDERFYVQFEMEHVSVEKASKLDICYIPDEYFEKIYSRSETRSRMLLELYNEKNLEIEAYIEKAIDESLNKRGIEKPEYILNCLHVFKCIENVASKYECAIVPFVFSAIRKVHGYEQTLYMAHIDNKLFNSNKAAELYRSWNAEKLGFPCLSRKEILALIGKKYNLFLLPLLEAPPAYELGVVGEGYHITPEIYQEFSATDDDIFYEARMYFSKAEITERLHPMQLDQAGIGRKHMKNDPAPFVLSCKRIATVQSQMIMKAAMWNRATITKGNALPYSFLMDSSLKSERILTEEELNFIVFSYFVPDRCMFNNEYWKWRMTGPSAVDIAIRHIKCIFEMLNLDMEILTSQNRLYHIIKNRGLTENEVNNICSCGKNIVTDYKYPLSFLTDSKSALYYSLNKTVSHGSYISTFEIEKSSDLIKVCLQNDVDGYITVKTVTVNGEKCYLNEKIVDKYFEKNANTFELILNERISFPARITVEWEGTYFNEK